MFSKPFRIKSNNQLKGTERKKLRAEILKSFPSISADDLLDFIPNKETLFCSKVVTYTEKSLLVYSTEKCPIVFELESVLFPTVYFLWRFPNLIHLFTTYPAVMPKLCGGADLMLPGIVLNGGIHINAYGKFEKGERIAVNLVTNKAPVAVGEAALSSFDMYMAANRGKAVIIHHFVGDNLFSLGTKGPVPDLGPPGAVDEKDDSDIEDGVDKVVDQIVKDESEIIDNVASMSVSDNVESVTCNNMTDSNDLNSDVESDNDGCETAVGASNNISDTFENKDNDCPEESSENAMDRMLTYCFLKSLKTSARDAKLPLLSSNFFRLHMIPACPANKSLDIKKSSYKKLSKFLNEMQSKNLISVKELTKGVDGIASINHNHDILREFVLDPEDVPENKCKDEGGITKPEINELYMVTAAVLPVLSEYLVRKGESLSLPAVRKYLTEYVKKHQLQDPVNRNMVKVGGTALQLCLKTKEEHVSWEQLITTFLTLMTRSYEMTLPNEKPTINKGKLEPIDIQVSRRSGNKKVTLINNLELYGIDMQKFSRDCQHGVAASTSISNVPGKKSAQLLVQGNQVSFVGNLLMDQYKIPKRYIRGLDLAVKPKKK